MNFILDVHCHTVASGHAYSTISENAAHAAKIGLTHIGVSDHAPGMPGGAHIYNFTNLWSLPGEINGVRVLKGAECNIMNETGTLDLDAWLLAKMDFVIASFHRGTFPPAGHETHTRAAIAAMENNPDMHILGHPGCHFFPINVQAVVSAAARTHTIIEINNQSLNPESFRFNGDTAILQMLKFCNEYNVPVLASSDAHICTNVGELSRAKKVILASGIKENLVLNTCEKRFLSAIAKKRNLGGNHELLGQA
ncbi:MAG: phosphatase [Defluviitaleaceae bacterium]|nr:phosphatase [Defluviitaleaceae bacterium]